MKRLSIVLLLATLMLEVAWAQRVLSPDMQGRNIYPISNANGFNKSRLNHGSRALTPIVLDYVEADAAYATLNTFNFYFLMWEVNKNYKSGPPQDTSGNFTCKWVAVRYDSLYDYIDEVGYPYAGSNLTVDTIGLYLNHKNNTGNNDTVTVKVLQRATNVGGFTSGNQGLTLTNTVLWDTVIVTNTSLTPATPSNQVDFWSIPCGASLPTGAKFIIYVEFAGDTANKFQVADFCRSDCGPPAPGSVAASASIFPDNSWRYFNLFFPGNPPNNFNGVGNLVFNVPPYQEGCDLFYFQNFGISALLTADIPLSLTVTQANITGCPGDAKQLEAIAVGGSAPYTYSWSNQQNGIDLTQVSVVVGTSTATYSVTVTDGDNNTVTASFTVTPQGINLNLGNDTTIACGQTLTICPQVSGTLTGAVYSWSTGATTLCLQNAGAGNHSLVVSNSAGCSATDAIVVSLTGVTQNINFTVPALANGQNWQRNCPLKLNNTSTDTTNWDFTWAFNDDNSVSFLVSPCHTWTALGTFNITLTATDKNNSACQFTLTKQIIIGQGACTPSSACVTGVAEMMLDAAISVYPNPNTGMFTIDMNDVTAKDMSIRVVNMQGQNIFTETLKNVNSSMKKNIDLTNAATGIYLINIQVDGTNVTKRVHVSRQ
jgi:hypothetical protein